ncbi:hypothetical protein QQ045_005748 [Rhodiola kirilowii]
MEEKGIRLGSISSRQIFTTMQKWHGLNTSLRHILQANSNSSSNLRTCVPRKASTSALWDRVVFTLSARLNAKEIDRVLGIGVEGGMSMAIPLDKPSYFREAVVALRLAKEVIKV